MTAKESHGEQGAQAWCSNCFHTNSGLACYTLEWYRWSSCSISCFKRWLTDIFTKIRILLYIFTPKIRQNKTLCLACFSSAKIPACYTNRCDVILWMFKTVIHLPNSSKSYAIVEENTKKYNQFIAEWDHPLTPHYTRTAKWFTHTMQFTKSTFKIKKFKGQCIGDNQRVGCVISFT